MTLIKHEIPEPLLEEEEEGWGGCLFALFIIIVLCLVAIWTADWVINLPIFNKH